MTFDILCIIRKIFLDPGKKRRCEYFNAKPVKQSVKKWYETTRRPRDIQEIKRDVAKKEMLKARKEGLL
jgi:DNA polymerase III delta prime subunit